MLVRRLLRAAAPLSRQMRWGKASATKEAETPQQPEEESNVVKASTASAPATTDTLVTNAAQSQLVTQSKATDKLKFAILGNETHAVQIHLDPGQAVRAEAGSLAFMSDGVTMDTNLVGGLGGSLRRMMTGSSLMLTDFTYNGEGSGRVVFSPEHPSKIIPLRLSEHAGQIICAKDSYLCAEPGLELDIEFVKKFSFGFFGGEGFILQKITGDGLLLLKGGGVVIEKILKDGEEIKVSSGNLMAIERTVAYDLQVVPGFKNVIFGGEGLFLTTLKGPGKIFLQSMPFSRIVSTIMQHLPTK